MLKKEFKKKDINRARNLITGNVNASSEIQIGYKKKRNEYKEGDIWTENKKTWTIKNGIKQTISKLDTIKKEIFLPLSCPKCKKIMKKRLDKPNYRIHKKCHDCVVKSETPLRSNGEYMNYIKQLEAKNSLDIIDEMEAYLLDAINTSNSQYVSEDGIVEKWVGGIDKSKLKKELKKSIKVRKDHIIKQLDEKK